jgi:hypothetical protein
MTKRRLVTSLLIATFVAGCAVHRPPEPVDGRQVGTDDSAGAAVANILYVPGRGIVCGASAIVSGVAMLLTLGQDYEGASELMHGGCSGPWLVRPQDIRQAVP